jgi:hypothetical protein
VAGSADAREFSSVMGTIYKIVVSRFKRVVLYDDTTEEYGMGVLSRLIYKGLMANVSERSCPNTANPESLVRTKYVAGEECQARSTRGIEVSNKGYQCLQP